MGNPSPLIRTTCRQEFEAERPYDPGMARPLHVTFAGGSIGLWRVDSLEAVEGKGLPAVERVAVLEGSADAASEMAAWFLRGVTSNERYVTREEHEALTAAQPALDRPEATRAALIPVRKTEEWWDLSQDQRRAVFEERSQHVAIGLEYLPAVARRLHHSRDLNEPFDFLTWFEYAPTDASAFEKLVERLRRTEEWTYVDREVDIRLTWDGDMRPRVRS